MRDVANLVADVVPNCVVTFADGASRDIRDYRVDFGRIERELPGYRPQWTVRRGIEELWSAYANGGMTPEMFGGPQYFRLRTIKGLLDRGELDPQLRQVSRI